MSEHYCNSSHKEWAEAGLKDYSDFADCVAYYNQREDYGDCLCGAWFADDAEKLAIYHGTFGNFNSPGASSYTYAEVYDDADEFQTALAALEALPEYLED